MTNVIVFFNWYLITCAIAGAVFFIRSAHKWWSVGLIRYPLVIIICALSWPIFIRKGYFQL